jgi:hypothetical protein
MALAVGSIFVPLGPGNSRVNLTVAVSKTTMIGAVFMHRRKPAQLVAMTVIVLLLRLMYGWRSTTPGRGDC